MKTKTEITVNQHGLEFETNLIFVDEVNDWFVDDYEMAKMALYKYATQLLPFAEEQEGFKWCIMRATKYFRNSTDMAVFAQAFCKEHKDHWMIRTTLRCDHIINENRKAIVLVNKETVVQRLITCKTCNVHGNSLELHARAELNEVEPPKEN